MHLSTLFNMHGYGSYVWGAYTLTLGMLAATVLYNVRSCKKMKKRLARLLEH